MVLKGLSYYLPFNHPLSFIGGGGGMGGMTLGWCGGKGEGTNRKPLCESTGVRESLMTLMVVALFLVFIKAFKNEKKLSTS